ncbi:MAG: peptide chain release factor N(5)-glutamine methyltransferase [Opitutales bacterium]|nr:peptide chain release factor N(5)-glutamine methyltransferase [Opitutales bacterium]
MNSLLELLKKSTEFLSKKGIENARLQSELIFAGTLRCRRLDLYLQFERPLAQPEVDLLRERVMRRARREPVQYIVGDTDFRNLTLKCDSRALIPRPETEELVDFVLEKLNTQKPAGTPVRVLDLGTGTGAIALSVATERAGTEVVAVDKSADALALARENLEKTGATANVTFLKSDWFENVSGAFDVIISNPPYLTRDEWECAQPEVKNYEPLSALVADNAGLADLEIILRGARERLTPGGFVAFETGIAQHEKLAGIARECGFSEIESQTDLSGRPRFFFAK